LVRLHQVSLVWVMLAWLVTPYSDVVGYQRFGGLRCLSLH